jgi:hypothetical protein
MGTVSSVINRENEMATIKIESNKAGKRFALVQSGDSFGVYAECHNYASHCKGGFSVTWRYCEKGLTKDDADALFVKKISGKQR